MSFQKQKQAASLLVILVMNSDWKLIKCMRLPPNRVGKPVKSDHEHCQKKKYSFPGKPTFLPEKPNFAEMALKFNANQPPLKVTITFTS